MDTVGARIKQIRLEKGLTLEDVHKKTKIHLNILKAIEEDNPVNLSPVYLKSFLKLYCNFLGVEPADYISGRKEVQASRAAQKSEKKHPPSPLKTSPLKTETLKLGGFMMNKKMKTVLAGLVILIIFSIALFKLGKFISSRPRPQAREAKIPQKTVEPVEAKKAPKKAPKKSKASEGADAKSVASVIRLGILVRESCWVTLKADGRIVFHGSLKKGKSETWQAKEKFELSLSNAGAVDLIVNGERILPLGKKGQARKNILITKEGITVP